MRRVTAALAALTVATIWSVPVAVQATPQDKITICHATASESNPYSKITVDKNSADFQGHLANNPTFGDNHPDGDIIPPFGEFAGQNWTPAGQAIYENNCNEPRPCPTVTVTAPPLPAVTVTATATETVPGPTATETVTSAPDPGPTVTITATETAPPLPAVTITETAPGPTVTATETETVPGPTVTTIIERCPATPVTSSVDEANLAGTGGDLTTAALGAITVLGGALMVWLSTRKRGLHE